jgi:hypothetical protein
MAEATQPKKTRQLTAKFVVRKHANSKPREIHIEGGMAHPVHAQPDALMRILGNALGEAIKDQHELVSLKLELGEPS